MSLERTIKTSDRFKFKYVGKYNKYCDVGH